MKLHERTMHVQRARALLHNQVINFAEQQELTNVEVTDLLLHVAGRFNLMTLRAERHPDDPEKKADEA